MLHDNNNDSNPKRVLMVLRRGLSRESNETNELITIVIMVIKCRRARGAHVKTYIIRGSRHVQTRRFSSLRKGLADGMIKKKKKTPAGPPIRHPLDRYIRTYT